MIKNKFIKSVTSLAVICGVLAVDAYGQNPAPAKPQTKPVTLTGATIHIGDGKIIEDGLISFNNGVITQVGPKGTSVPTGSEMVDVKGKHIYPGIISLNTTVGLQEIASVRATLDFVEVGELNPHVRALRAFNTDSEVIPTLRNNGILLSQAVPQGGIISGASSVFYMDGWNWEDAVLKADDGIWLNWPSFLARSFNYADFSLTFKKNENRQKAIDLFSVHFKDAKAYIETANPSPVNLRLEGMRSLFSGKSNLYIRADYGKDIIESVRFAQEMGVKKIVIVGGKQALKVASFLQENQIPVILDESHRLPEFADDNIYEPYELPGLLHQAGVKVAISYAGEWWRTRNLSYQAGQSAAFTNIVKEDALQFITKNAAEIAGIANEVGTLEKGKQASFVVTDGNIMDMRGNAVKMVYIRGGKVDTDDKQKRLYEKYQDKFGTK